MKRAGSPGRLSKSLWVSGAILAAVAAGLRLAAMNYGLPQVFNADEPHVVNMAVSLAGSLKPVSFKYPTLWPTILAFFYGLWFLVWSGFGLLRGAIDFAAHYAFEPTGFYVIGRFLAVCSQMAGLWMIARVERYADDKKWFFGALILACSPTLIELAHSVKPDSFMFLLVTGSLMFALKYQKEGRRRWLMTSAALAGLACSTQYTAAPAAIIVPLAWALSSKRHAPLLWLGQALLIGVVAFAAGSPYAVIDYPRFISDWSDYADLGRLKPHDAVQTGWIVAKNIWCYAGEGSLAGAAAIVGLVIGLKRNASRTLLLLIPILSYAVILSMSFDGVVPRYLLGAFPMLALLSSEGLSWISGSRTMVRALAAITVMVPGLLLSGAMDLDFLRPDTRTQATQWINEHIPQGQTLLLDQPHAGPMVVMTQQQCADLADRAEKNKSSRSRLFRAMASRHPGGGWRIYRVQRAARDLWSSPKHVAQSQADGDFLDVRPGLDVARAARIDWIVTSSFGADPRRSRELSTFFSELGAQAELVREFPFQAGAVVGPWLRVYHLKRG